MVEKWRSPRRDRSVRGNDTQGRARSLQHEPKLPVHHPGMTWRLTGHGIQIRMEGKGCWRENVLVDRLGKNVKSEEVYLQLQVYETP